MSDKVQYKITNCTRWPGAKKGKHKRGFVLHINRKNLHVNRHIFVNELSEGIEAMHQQKWVKIDTVKDRHLSINKAIKDQEKENETARKKAEADIKDEEKERLAKAKEEAEEEVKRLKEEQKNSTPASTLGLERKEFNEQHKSSAKVPNEGDSEDPLDGLEEADYENSEEPNFVVQAGKKGKGKNKKGKNKNSNS